MLVMIATAAVGHWWLNGGPESLRQSAVDVWNEPIEVELKEGETRQLWLDPEKMQESVRRTLSGG